MGHTPEMVKKTGMFALGAAATIGIVMAFVDCSEKKE